MFFKRFVPTLCSFLILCRFPSIFSTVLYLFFFHPLLFFRNTFAFVFLSCLVFKDIPLSTFFHRLIYLSSVFLVSLQSYFFLCHICFFLSVGFRSFSFIFCFCHVLSIVFLFFCFSRFPSFLLLFPDIISFVCLFVLTFVLFSLSFLFLSRPSFKL